MKLSSTRLSLFLACALLHLSAAAAPDTAELSFINGLPFTTVKIGAAASRMMIDTGGALGLSIPESTVKRAGSVTLLDTKSKFRDLHGAVFEVPNLVARQVTVGTTDLGSVEGKLHVQWGGQDSNAELNKAREAGAIGVAAFGDRPLMFDYAKRQVVIYAPGEGPEAGQEGWQALPLAYGKEGPNVRLLVNGKPRKFVLDTGAPVNIVDAGTFSAEAPDCQGCQRPLGELRDEAGRSLGAFKAMPVNLNGAPFDGILGASFFQAHRVLIDIAGRRMLIAPNAR